MKTQLRSVAAVMILAFTACSAHAFTLSTTISDGPKTLVAGATTIDFGNSTINNTGTVSAAPPSGTTPSGVTYAYSGGGEFNFDSSSTLPNGTSARPVGSTGNFWSIGTSSGQNTTGVVTFANPVNYYGFLWGSPDRYNTVSFYNGNTLIQSFDGSVIKQPPNGDQSYAKFLNVFADQGNVITKVTFSSTSNAFETDNHAFAAAVPEPETYAMLLAGLGLIGAIARRRSQAK
jgi:hypothetical protein